MGHVRKSQLLTNHVAAKFRGFQKKQALQMTGGSGPIWERPYDLHASHVPATVDLYVLWWSFQNSREREPYKM